MWTTASKDGGCVDFKREDYIDVPLDVLSHIRDEITVAFWANGNPNNPDDSSKKSDCVFHAKYSEQQEAKVLGIFLPEPNKNDDEITWDTSNPNYEGFADRLDTPDAWTASDYRAWHHYAFTKDADSGVMTIYIDGDPCISDTHRHQQIYGAQFYHEGETGVMIGIKVKEIRDLENHTYMFGRLDDFRIYDYALSDSDIARLYNLQEPLSKERGDFDGSGRVNFEDYADLGNNWLKEQLWP